MAVRVSGTGAGLVLAGKVLRSIKGPPGEWSRRENLHPGTVQCFSVAQTGGTDLRLVPEADGIVVDGLAGEDGKSSGGDELHSGPGWPAADRRNDNGNPGRRTGGRVALIIGIGPSLREPR
jgi:hypothetical protein